MEIKRIGQNKIRCALTEEEIRGMGFNIDDIIGNGETTQEFMHLILKIVEEKENISLDNVSPMVKAELLSDHSMAITFGGESELSIQEIMDVVTQFAAQLTPEKAEAFKRLTKEEKQNLVDTFVESRRARKEEKKQEAVSSPENRRVRKETLVCALKFSSLEKAVRMSRVCFAERYPESCLYRLGNFYYMVLDFSRFTKEEMRKFAIGVVEYDDGRASDIGRISYIVEHGECIVKKQALQTLMAL